MLAGRQNVERETPVANAAERGHTLVEVLVAAAALGIMLTMYFAGLKMGDSIINTLRQDLRATQILTQKTEDFRLCTWTNVSSLPPTFQAYYSQSTTNSTANSLVYYGTISTSSPTNIPSYGGLVKVITVQVTWTNYFSRHPVAHTRQMQTLVAANGLVNYILGSQ